MKKCHCLQQDLNPGPCGCKSNAIPTQLQQLSTLYYMQKWFIYCPICVPDQFLSDESCKLWLSPKDNSNTRGLTREYPKYPLTQSVGRENLSGESLVSCAPSRFSLTPSFDRGYSRILTVSPPSITICSRRPENSYIKDHTLFFI